jgi:hypothetical protein
MLLSLMFADDAFAATKLTEPKQLFDLRVPLGLNQLEVPIRESKMETLLFRGLERNHLGNEVSEVARITDKWLRERMKHLGEVTGFELPAVSAGGTAKLWTAVA